MEIIQYINTYSVMISITLSLITAIITLVYVIFTYKQMKATQSASETAIKQMQLNNQPCVIYENIYTRGTACITATRRQLNIDLDIENIGDSPAISVYIFSHLELQYIKNSQDNSNIVNMYYFPYFIPFLKPNCKTVANICYESKEINILVEDLKIKHEKNIQRLKKDFPESPYKGTNLAIEVYYKNILGQWFKNTRHTEILYIIDKHAKLRKTNYINENTIPPKDMKSDTEFKLQFISPSLSLFNIEAVDEKEIMEKLQPYDEDMPFKNTKMYNK